MLMKLGLFKVQYYNSKCTKLKSNIIRDAPDEINSIIH